MTGGANLNTGDETIDMYAQDLIDTLTRSRLLMPLGMVSKIINIYSKAFGHIHVVRRHRQFMTAMVFCSYLFSGIMVLLLPVWVSL